MDGIVIVHKGRTNVITVGLGMDVSADTITSEIRTEPSQESDLLATWAVVFVTDGTNGELVLTLDDAETSEIDNSIGYMDLKRVVNGEPLPIFDKPLQVSFRDTVTV